MTIPLQSKIVTSRQATGTPLVVTKATLMQRVLGTEELLDLVFVFLKAMAISNSLYNPDLTAPTTWKRTMVPLVRVNNAFARATTRVIWGEMDNLWPFFALLAPSFDKAGFREFPDGITASDWKRFTLYASHTKALTLNSASSISPTWALYIAMASDRPTSLFPSLRQIVIASDDILSFLVATSACPTVQHVHIQLDPTLDGPAVWESVTAFTASLFRDAKRLTGISLIYPVDIPIIRNVSKIASIRYLALHIRSGRAADIAPLVSMDLETLFLSIEPLSVDLYEAPTRDSAAQFTSLRTSPMLHTLTVLASPNSHRIILSILAPTSLNNLNLEVIHPVNSTKGAQLFAFVLAVHTVRNPNLVSLNVINRGTCNPSEPFDNTTSAFDPTPLLLRGLSAAKSLRTINMELIQIPSPYFLSMILGTLPNLQELQKFHFRPIVYSGQHPGRFQPPSYGSLQEIAAKNPHLLHLSMPMDSRLPLPPIPERFNVHRMQTLILNLYPFPEENSSIQLPTTSIALYLHRLFPHLQSLPHCAYSVTTENRFWSAVQQTMFALQNVRNRTIQEAQMVSLPDHV